jgi:hypothetical protein
VHRTLVEEQQRGIEDRTASGAVSAATAVVGVMKVVVSHVVVQSFVSSVVPTSAWASGDARMGGCFVRCDEP